MDKRSNPNLQLKDRETKIYNQKADLKTKEIKTITSTPKIDALSRKIAEIMTQRELSELGIQISDPSPKRQTFTIPKPVTPTVLQKTKKISEPLMSPLDNKIEEPEPNPGHQFSESKDVILLSGGQNEELKRDLVEVGEIKETQEVEVKLEGNNTEKVQDLQAEPQVDNPDLGKDSEDKLKEPPPQIQCPESKPEELSTLPQSPSNPLLPSHLPSIIDHIPQRSSLTDKKNCELFEVCSTLLKGRTEATTVTSRTPDIIRNQSLKQQESALKANFLHCNKSEIGRYTPRCHISLFSGQSSPIFMSFRVPNDAIMKSEHGFASAESLRHTLLRNLLQESPVQQDFYSKNLEWLQKKEEKVEKKRTQVKELEIEGCTFDPYFERHEKKRIEDEVLDYKATVRPDLLQSSQESFEFSARLNTVEYFSLSPVALEIKYSQGFNFDKLLASGKPMVDYLSVNSLK